MERDIVFFRTGLLCGLPRLLQRLFRLPVSRVQSFILLQFILVSGQDVDDVQLEVLFVQQQVLVLGMHVDEHFPQFLELAHGSGRIVDERPALAGYRDFTADDTFFSVELQIVAFEELLHAVGTQVENGFDDTFRHTVFYGFTVCALTEQQSDCPEDNGLSGAGFSGNDGKSRLEPDV